MKVYAIENDPDRLLLVTKENYIVNGGYHLKSREDGSMTYLNKWKAYYVMRVAEAEYKKKGYNQILDEVSVFIKNPPGQLHTGG